MDLLMNDKWDKYKASNFSKNANDKWSKYKASNYQKSPIQQEQMPLQNQSLLELLEADPMTKRIANSAPVEGVLGVGDALRNLLSLGYANPNPTNTHSTAYDIGHLAGEIGSFLGGGSALKTIPAIKNANALRSFIGRMLGSTGFEAAQNKEDRLGGAIKGAESGAIGEALRVPFSLLGLAAEKYNPIKFAKAKQNEILQKAQRKKEEMQDSYNKAIAAAGETKIPYFHNKENILSELKSGGLDRRKLKVQDNPLGFSTEQLRYFTPNLKKAYEGYKENPIFNTLHDFQSQLGKESARLSGVGSKIKTYQHLKEARDMLHEKIIPSVLGPDSQAYKDYQIARHIGRSEYYPYESNKAIGQIVHGRSEQLSPQNLLEAIQDVHRKRPMGEQLAESHPLSLIQKELEKKMATSQLMQGLTPFAGGAVGMAGGPLGGAMGVLAAPALLKAAQNPELQKFSSKNLSPLIRAILASPTFANENLGL